MNKNRSKPFKEKGINRYDEEKNKAHMALFVNKYLQLLAGNALCQGK